MTMHPSAYAPAVYGTIGQPAYNPMVKASKLGRFVGGSEKASMMPGWRGAAGSVGMLAQQGGQKLRGLGSIMKGVGNFAKSSAMWGIGTKLSSKTLLGGIAKRALVPGLMLGAFGLLSAGRNLVGGGYSVDSSRVSWGGMRGMSAPYTQQPMSFGTAGSMNAEINSTAGLAFALHNQRKA